jgi:ribose transport system substrate-binding protein
MQRRTFLVSLAAVAAQIACNKDKPAGGADPSGSSGGAASKPRIAVIPKGTTHEFWKSVHAGAVKAAGDANVEIVWKGPLKEDDLKSQIDLVQSFVAQGVKGIVLAPLSDTALRGPVKAAKAAGIPVVIMDSDLQGDDKASFVATDNDAAGKMAGEAMAKLLGDDGTSPASPERGLQKKPSVVVLRYQEGSASTAHREQGFLDAIKPHLGVAIASENQYGGATTESAFATSESLLAAQKASSGGVNGVFAPNESTTFGMLLALRKAGLAGKIKLVGFDASDKLVDALKSGDIDALVVQDPFRIGELAVKTMADILAGKTVEKRIDTGAKLVTKASLDDPAIQALLKPDLKKWLGE